MGTKSDTQNAAWLLKPADSDSLNQADDEIRSTRRVQQERIAEEHVNLVTTPTNDQGVHKPGSAIIYTGTSFPTKRPDGVTSFTTALDKGRLFVNTSTGVQYVLLTADGADNNVWGAITSSSSFGDFDVGGDLNVATDGVIGRNLEVGGNINTVGGYTKNGEAFIGFRGNISLLSTATEATAYTAISTASLSRKPVFGYFGDVPGGGNWLMGLGSIDYGQVTLYYSYINSGAFTLGSKLIREGNATQIGKVLNLFWLY
jgi:hypothetical protein